MIETMEDKERFRFLLVEPDEDVAREIERTADQDARRHRVFRGNTADLGKARLR